MVVRALIVEDEPLARRTLHTFSAEVEWLKVVGESAEGRTAVRLIDSLLPDLVLLDVQIPELSGLEVLRQVTHHPAIVFTTAYDSYAITAFELGALDYLLKPFGRARFKAAMNRVRERFEDKQAQQPDIYNAPISLVKSTVPLTRLFVRDRNRIVPLKTEDISRFEAEDDYLRVYTRERSYLIHLTLNDMEGRLDGTRFFRVHRSIIVNIEHIEQVEPHDRRLSLRLRDGTDIIASRAYSQSLRKLIF